MGIYVWGTGCGASDLVEHGLAAERIRGFVDSFPRGREFLGRPVLRPEEVKVSECDLMVVTTRFADEVASACDELGIPREKVLFLKNEQVTQDRNQACAAAGLLGQEVLARVLPKKHIVVTPVRLAQSALTETDQKNDYVRTATLELLCRRVKDLPGAAAELGVYRGAFARCINALCPERKLYLFDSFDGFLPGEGASKEMQAAHGAMGAERVLANLPHPERAVVKQGYFPESLEGMEDVFCLVSLDVDYEQTTLSGLRYFWPRMVAGGYLMIHDWDSDKLPGVKRALERYEAELGHKIPAVPLCDIGGSLVLCK